MKFRAVGIMGKLLILFNHSTSSGEHGAKHQPGNWWGSFTVLLLIYNNNNDNDNNNNKNNNKNNDKNDNNNNNNNNNDNSKLLMIIISDDRDNGPFKPLKFIEGKVFWTSSVGNLLLNKDWCLKQPTVRKTSERFFLLFRKFIFSWWLPQCSQTPARAQSICM